MNYKLLSLLCCPQCQASLSLSSNKQFITCKQCKQKYPLRDGIPDFLAYSDNSDLRLSQEKWDTKYREDAKKNIYKEINYQEKKFFLPTWKQIIQHYIFKKGDIFLELGCGLSFFSRRLAKLGMTVVGIDISLEALKLAKTVFDKDKITNYLFVRGNVLCMPFKKNSFDLLYGGGVIEHFKDTLSSIKELQRVLKKGGVAYNTVPYLNIGSLTYRQIWGNIPRLPILEDVCTFFHIKILKSKHMRFGYELSFTQSYLKNIHKRAGFSQVKTGQFNCKLDFDYLKNKTLRQLAIYLATHSRFFWPMIYVMGKK